MTNADTAVLLTVYRDEIDPAVADVPAERRGVNDSLAPLLRGEGGVRGSIRGTVVNRWTCTSHPDRKGYPTSPRMPGRKAMARLHYRPFFFRHSAKSVSVCGSVAG